MGIIDCSTHSIQPTEAEYFYNKNSTVPNMDDDSMKQPVKLEVCIKNIKSGRCKVQLVLFKNAKKTEVLPGGGETEESQCDSSTEKISFLKFFITNYFFEMEQPIDFIISGSINAKISTNLPKIMGSRGQLFSTPIEGCVGAVFEVKGFAYKTKQTSNITFDINLSGNLKGMGIIYTIKNLGNIKIPQNNLLYKSEMLSQDKKNKLLQDLIYKQCSIPDIYLAPDTNYHSNNIEVEFYDFYHSKSVGRYSGTLGQLIDNKKTYVEVGKSRKCYINVNRIMNYSFIDYLRGGMQINLTVAIDFTASNGLPTSPQSLHYLSPQPNQYEIAIQSCGNIVAYYDYDQLFPVFGFGGKFYGSPVAHHCYPLNNNPQDPSIRGIEGILQAYRQVLGQTQLYGPTFFHFIIDDLVNRVKADVEREMKMNYNILMILTDGVIEDIDETIDSLVEASFLPISVIIIGIGKADFSNMNVLDADEEALVDSKNRKADRDLVQFVPFDKYKGNGEKLAQEVLEEIPKQVIEYYQHQKIPPGEPIYQLNA